MTSAYLLTCAGHEVTALDREDGLGREASFANVGQVSFDYALA